MVCIFELGYDIESVFVFWLVVCYGVLINESKIYDDLS